MKKGLLLFLGFFALIYTVSANNNYTENINNTIKYNYSDAVNFIEKGIEFYIYTNGEFDFNTRKNSYYYNRRNTGVSIERDYRGRIRRVGSAFIDYNRYGNVARIGNVAISYYQGQLTRVGNLSVRYDNWGYPLFYGRVKNNYYNNNGVRINLNIGDICDYNDSYFSHRDFRRNYAQIREDNNYYYYKAYKNAKIGKRSQIIRRRKPVVSNRNTNIRKPVRDNNFYKKREYATPRNNKKVSKYRKVTPNTRNYDLDRKNRRQ